MQRDIFKSTGKLMLNRIRDQLPFSDHWNFRGAPAYRRS